MSRIGTRHRWEVVVVVFTTLASLSIPLSLIPGWRSLRLVGPSLWAVTAVFAVDALIRWRHRTISADGDSVMVHVVADLLPALPLYWITGVPILMLLMLAKLVRVGEFARDLLRHQIQRAAYLRLAFFSYGLCLVAHWITCGWIALRPSEAASGPSWSTYVHAVYWCVSTLTTVGYGDVVPSTNAQTIYSIAVMILGVGVYAYIIGNIATILTNIDPARARYLQHMDHLGAFVRYRQIPHDLQRRIRDYYDFVWEKRLGYDESEILSSLPVGLREEVALFLKRDFLERVPLFAQAPSDLTRRVALRMVSEIFTPGDYVVRAGETGRDMYFIVRGAVEVIHPSGQVVNVLREGDYFGEIALLEDRPRNASVRAVDYCDLYRLSRDVFSELVAHHDDLADAIRCTARERSDESAAP